MEIVFNSFFFFFLTTHPAGVKLTVAHFMSRAFDASNNWEETTERCVFKDTDDKISEVTRVLLSRRKSGIWGRGRAFTRVQLN